jgi:hypothetical protein
MGIGETTMRTDRHGTAHLLRAGSGKGGVRSAIRDEGKENKDNGEW